MGPREQVAVTDATTRGKFRGRCHYCHAVGHRFFECRKRQQAREAAGQEQQPQAESTGLQTEPNREPAPQQVLSVARSTSGQQQDAGGVSVDPAKECKEPVTTNEAGLPVCHLTVQGTRPVACVLDSGASTSIVSSEFAASLGSELGGECTSVEALVRVQREG